MKDGYMQLEMAEECRKLTTFYMHRGLERFKRLHFWVNILVFSTTPDMYCSCGTNMSSSFA